METVSYCRRGVSRIAASESVYAFWSCDGRDGLSRVRDLSLRGVFIESPVQQSFDAPVKLDFLADEGQIRASAVVRHVKPGQGLGLRFIAIDGQDGQRLASLLKRLRTSPSVCLSY
ncbi:MAG TPA: PilZ domain-containing protein [Candidatus Acidoferrum sp.]